MVSLSITTNYPAAHMRLYSPVRRDMTAVAALRRHAVKTVSRSDEHWNYCHKVLPEVSKSFATLVLQLTQPQLRDSICTMYLLLRNLDTIEDDMEIPDEVKIPTLYNYHRCLSDNDWRFICGTNADRELTKGHHHIQAAFMELESSSQEIIYQVTKTMSQGMAKFIPMEIKTMKDYEEYTGYVHALFISGTLRLAHALIGEDIDEDSLTLLSHSMGCLHQDFQYEENSVKALRFLNEMVINALSHTEDCLDFMCKIRDPMFFRFYVVPRIDSIGELALCYNNLQIFRKTVKPESLDLKARIFNHTKTMTDVYGAFYDISCLMKTKVNDDDPCVEEILRRLDAIKQKCMDSGTLATRNSVIFESVQDII